MEFKLVDIPEMDYTNKDLDEEGNHSKEFVSKMILTGILKIN